MRSISLRRADDPADPSVHARAGKAFHRQVASTTRSKIITRSLLVLVAIIGVAGLVAGLSKPLAMRQLEQQVAADHAKIVALEAPQFPVGSVQQTAMARVAQCGAYSDQASTEQVSAVETDCGWNGQGVGTPIGLPQYDPNPHIHPAVQDGYTALPYDVQLMGVGGMLTYYVPVQQTTTDTAVVAGMPTPLNSPPTFVINGCPNATTQNASGNSRVQAVDDLVSGASRYTIPGVTIKFNGNGLTGATAGDEQLCQPTGNTQIVLATVTYNGPTSGSQIAVGVAFATTVISTGEARVSAIGLNAAYRPQITSP